MDKIQKILQQKYLARLIVIILALSFVLIFNGLTRTINHAIKNIFYSIQRERQLDTNIVIIHIDENDIQRLGG